MNNKGDQEKIIEDIKLKASLVSCGIADSLWGKTLSLIEEIQAENTSLRRSLIKTAKFALDICGEDECSGDESAGLFPCEMWEYCEDKEGRVFSRCFLEHILAELEKEENNYD